MKPFPSDFLWGATVSAHQVEGENYDSDWWHYEQRPGRIQGDATSQGAAEHWSRWREDFDLVRQFGMRALLISIEWSRIQPAPDTFDHEAVDHYRRVLEALRERDIEPLIVLHHVTLPQWFAKSYGWHHKRAPQLFEEYVDHVLPALGPLCTWWIPIQEPMHWISMAYLERCWPPAARSHREAASALKNMGRAHALAYRKIHAAVDEAKVGPAIRARRFVPYDQYSGWDVRTARREERRCNTLFLDAVVQGKWPVSLRTDTEVMGTADFIGVSYLGQETLRFSPWRLGHLYAKRTGPDGASAHPTATEVSAEGFYDVMTNLTHYNLPMIVTGTGLATEDDSERCRFIVDHVEQARRMLEEGVDLRGFLVRSLLDGFEWADGYSQRYGLFHVDMETKSRMPNGSAYLFKELSESGELRQGTIHRFCNTQGSDRVESAN